MKIMISACLAGVNCKYNGKSNQIELFERLAEDKNVILVCPEQLGGCPTPRPTAEIIGNGGCGVLDGNAKVKRNDGTDATKEFLLGAEIVLKIAKENKLELAVLKSKSPSCGCGKIYDGSFSGRLIDGNGVTTELLIRNGIQVMTEMDYERFVQNPAKGEK